MIVLSAVPVQLYYIWHELPFTLCFGELCLILKENCQYDLGEGDINPVLMLFSSIFFS